MVMVMAKRTKISIITVSFNAVEYIEQTIKSVINQSYPNIEYIVVDGASTDGTVEVINKYKGRLKFISEKDKGISDAFNKGINLATGELVFFLSADDYFYSNSIIDIVIENYEAMPCDILHGNILMLNEATKIKVKSKPDASLKSCYFGQPIKHGATFVTKRAYEKVGGYKEKYKYAMDYDLTLNLIKNNCSFNYIDLDIAIIRTGGVNQVYRMRTIDECFDIARSYNVGWFKANAFRYWKYIKFLANGSKIIRKVYDLYQGR